MSKHVMANMTQLSSDGTSMIERVARMRQSPEFLTYRLMEANALPAPDKVGNIDVDNLRAVVAQRASSVEERMSQMLAAIHMIPSKDKLDDKYCRDALKTTAIRAIEHTVEVSRDPCELESAVKMFLDQRSIVIRLAQNPHIGEHTLLTIANSAIYKGDSQVGRALAQNHNMTPRAARVIAENFKSNQFIMYVLADNVSKQARAGTRRDQFAQVCKELTALHPINFPLAPAIRGITESHHLRALYEQHSKRPVIERNLDHATFHAIAQNPDTPIDVITRMAKEAPLTSVFGKDSTVTHGTIRQRLAAAIVREQSAATQPDDTMRPM